MVELYERRNTPVARAVGWHAPPAVAGLRAGPSSPSVLFLDEPTVGIDPPLRVQFWNYFRKLAAEGATLVVSSHVMDEADRCDELLLMLHGKLLARGSGAEIRAQAGVDGHRGGVPAPRGGSRRETPEDGMNLRRTARHQPTHRRAVPPRPPNPGARLRRADRDHGAARLGHPRPEAADVDDRRRQLVGPQAEAARHADCAGGGHDRRLQPIRDDITTEDAARQALTDGQIDIALVVTAERGPTPRSSSSRRASTRRTTPRASAHCNSVLAACWRRPGPRRSSSSRRSTTTDGRLLRRVRAGPRRLRRLLPGLHPDRHQLPARTRRRHARAAAGDTRAARRDRGRLQRRLRHLRHTPGRAGADFRAGHVHIACHRAAARDQPRPGRANRRLAVPGLRHHAAAGDLRR